MLSLWGRLPVLVRATLAGAVVSAVGVLTWSAFARANQLFFVRVPWAVVPMTAFLWLFWRYLKGESWPRATSAGRRASLRANALSPDVWGMSIFAGLLGLAALLPLVALLGRLVTMPAESQPIRVPPEMPFIAVFVLLLMASVVAGVVEEAAFRGYLQGPIERRHGPLVAILFTGSLFGLAHYSHHPASVLAMLPYYVAVTAVYGGLAYATNSILPGLVLHAGGDVVTLTRLWLTGKPEWDVAVAAPRLIWDTGPDAAFWGSLTAFILLGSAATWAITSLAGTARREQPPLSRDPLPSAT